MTPLAVQSEADLIVQLESLSIDADRGGSSLLAVAMLALALHRDPAHITRPTAPD